MPAEEQPDRGPRILKDRFRLLSQLAKGGMGITYRAWDEQSGRPVVVKMPKRALFDEPGFLERFDREVRATASLDHPFVVKVVDHGIDAGEPFLAMQFLPGGSLASRIKQHAERGRERLPTTQLHSWLPRIAAALDHAHAGGIIHRDVKPANIFFDSQGLAYLGDFGIAKIIEDSAADAGDATLTGTHMTLGTGAYMAPERLKARGAIDGRADQYALAICVFETLAGVKPFRSTTEYIFVEQATMPPPDLAELRADVQAACCKAIAKALAKSPDKRFSTCTEFAEAVLEGSPEAEQDTAFAWLECPACRNLIRLPQAAAGREGRCPRCKAALVIAHDLEGLWLPDEYGPAAAVAAPLVAAVPEASPQPQSWRWNKPRSWAAIAAVTSAALLLPWLWPQPPAPAPPDPDTGRGAGLVDPVVDAVAKPETPPEQLAAKDADSPPAVEPQPAKPDLAEATNASAPPAPPSPPPEPPPVAPPPAEIFEAKVELEAEWAAKRDAAKKHFDEVVHWVKVEDPGNQPDPQTGRGAVAEPFYLAQYELTNGDYCVFLNASRAGMDLQAGLGDRAIHLHGPMPGIARRSRSLGQGFEYTPLPDMAQKPAVLSASDAIALANWLHNIHRSGADAFESGAYPALESPSDRTPDALFFIPTIDEWVKAAYFKAGKRRGTYTRFPTGTNTPLVPVSGPMPFGRPALRGVETAANFGGKARWDGAPSGGAPTDVGMNGAPSAYGAFDMAGNATEWATIVLAGRVLFIECGGGWQSPLDALDRTALKSLDQMARPADQTVSGVRLARSVSSVSRTLPFDPPGQVFLKAPTFKRLRLLENIAGQDNKVVRNLRNVSNADVGRVLDKLQPANPPDEEVDVEVAAAEASLERNLEAAKTTLQGRDAEFRRLLPATRVWKPADNPVDGLLKFVEGIQAQDALQAAIEACDAQLGPIQAQVLADIDRLPSLRKTIESRYGKP